MIPEKFKAAADAVLGQTGARAVILFLFDGKQASAQVVGDPHVLSVAPRVLRKIASNIERDAGKIKTSATEWPVQ